MRGTVRIHRPGPGGSQKVLHFVEAPRLIAEVPTMMGKEFPATGECSDECTVLVLPRRSLVELAVRDPEVPLRILGAAYVRLRKLTRLLADHGQRSAVVRVASFLIGRGQHRDIALPAAKKDVANYLGLKPETFSRALATLREHGAIEVDEMTIRVLDRTLLEAVLDEG